MDLNKLYPYEIPEDATVPEGVRILVVDDMSLFTTFGYRLPVYREERKGVRYFSPTPISPPSQHRVRVAPKDSKFSFAVYDNGWLGYGNGDPAPVETEDWEDAVLVPESEYTQLRADSESDKSPVKDKDGDVWYWYWNPEPVWQYISPLGEEHKCESKQHIRTYTGGELRPA